MLYLQYINFDQEALTLDNILAERFSFLIKKSNLTYEQVAQALGLKSKGTISKYATRKNQKNRPCYAYKNWKTF